MVFSLQILGVPTTVSSTHGLAGLLVASAMMAGCGQKGPLFIATPPISPAAATINPELPPAVMQASPFNTRPTPTASAPR